MNTELKRRAVYTVLSDVLEGGELWQVMWCWQDGYAEKSQFELNRFLSECSHIGEISKNRSTIYRKLISSMMLEDHSLKPDPLENMGAYRSETIESDVVIEEKTTDTENWSYVFTDTLVAVFEQLRSDTEILVIGFASEQAARHQLNSQLAYAFTLWSTRRETMRLSGVLLSDLRKLLNYIYVGLCEVLGPVESDRILASALAVVTARKGGGIAVNLL